VKRAVLMVLLAMFAASAPAAEFYGMLRARDLSPFGFLRLDLRPAHAVPGEAGSWSVEADYAFQNSWALSPNVERYLTGLEAQGRRTLGDADVAAIRDLPGENYLVDLEMAQLDLTVHYNFSSRLSAYLILSGVSYDGGFLDTTIESFHDTFGFSSFGRGAVARNGVNLVYDLKSASYARLGAAPSSGGVLDPTIGLRYSGLELGRWSVSVEAAAKPALGGERALLSTGRTDIGVQAVAQYRARRHAFYLDVAAVHFAGGEFPVPQDEQIVPTLILGYEYVLTRNTNVNLQAYASRSVYSRNQTDLRDLLADKYQVTAGVRHRVRAVVVTFGITENVQNLNNTPDIGFQLGAVWLPEPGSRY
jgi:hypothetical protein